MLSWTHTCMMGAGLFAGLFAGLRSERGAPLLYK